MVHGCPVSCVPLLGVEFLHCDQLFEVGAWAVVGVGLQVKVLEVEVEVVEVKERLRHSVADFLVRS